MNKRLPLLLCLLLSLSGCVFVVGAAAGAAAVAVVYDHRKLEKIMQDQQIATQITDRIANPGITVTCFNQIVLLTGEVPNAPQKQRAGEIAGSYAEVKKVYNQITVRGPTSSLTRASDTWITTKIRTQLLATKDLASGSIKVVTENGCVYLMGIVTRDQADTAVDIARRVSGVQKVVKIFSYRS